MSEKLAARLAAAVVESAALIKLATRVLVNLMCIPMYNNFKFYIYIYIYIFLDINI
jgi:hypothetical protein